MERVNQARMKRKVFRWLICASVAVIILVIIGILSVDTIARFTAERRVRAETGMETKIGKFTVGFASATIHIENFVMKNPAQFGGETFVDMPELHFEYDREALRSGKLRFKLVRINIAEIHVVENKDGLRNVDELQKHQAKSKSSNTSTNRDELPFVFDGIDALDVTLRIARFTNLGDPRKNMATDLGIRNETFNNLKTEMDFQTVAAVLAIKAGASFLWSGDLTNPFTLLKQGSKAGTETKNILEGLTEPVLKKPAATNP